jgi:hypothetical protein
MKKNRNIDPPQKNQGKKTLQIKGKWGKVANLSARAFILEL